MLNQIITEKIILNALEEDMGSGDITTISTVPEDTCAEGIMIAKEKGVICGLPVVTKVFELIDRDIEIVTLVNEGDLVETGAVIARISGKARGILSGERVALNFLQRMSGVATITRSYAEKIADTKAVITDTRKTTPGLRYFEKYAVRTGGGVNHRYDLSDGVLIKDNHIIAAGGIAQAIERCRGNVSHLMKIEIETENMNQIREALTAGADVIMLDNMSISEMKEAVKVIDGKALVEASGNMGEKDIREVALTGVDLISVGSLTHSFKALDISLKFNISR